MAKGWISIHRKIEDCQIWLGNEPYDRRSAWISILLMANHEDKDILFDGQMVTVKRGQFITSVRHLGQKWMWSKDRTLRYLRLLEALQMIHRESDNRRTLITIIKYENYQDMRDSNEDTHKDSNKDTDKDADTPQTIMKNNENNNIYNVELRSKIISYLNQKCGTNYKASTVNTKKHINARLNDGYKYEDFVKVIDNKYKDWKGTEWEQYLRPDTLFGTKFESYLNQRIVKEPVTKQHFENQNSYDFADLEKKLLGG